MRRLLLILVLCVGCSAASDEARSIEGQVWSPYCPGRLLVDCSTTQARQLRDEIDQRIDRGDSPEEVLDWVRQEYGDQAVARPDASARGLVIWLVPAAFFIAGGLIVARFVSRNLDPSTTNKPESTRRTHADP